MLVDNETTITISFVSFPVMVSGFANCPITTHDPDGTGEDKIFNAIIFLSAIPKKWQKLLLQLRQKKLCNRQRVCKR